VGGNRTCGDLALAQLVQQSGWSIALDVPASESQSFASAPSAISDAT